MLDTVCVSPAQVEQYNSHVQSSFAQRMDVAFADLQQRLQQQEGSQRHLLAGYTRAVGQNSELNQGSKIKDRFFSDAHRCLFLCRWPSGDERGGA